MILCSSVEVGSGAKGIACVFRPIHKLCRWFQGLQLAFCGLNHILVTMKRGFAIVLVFLCSASVIKAQAVYKTPSGKKYHLSSCRMVENVSQKITLTEALELQLGACLICKPDGASVNTLISTTQTPRGQSQTVQCNGLTKAGARCRHRTSIANGYCFQHNPDK